MKNYPVSQSQLGGFILDCFKKTVEVKKLTREIEKMCQKLCLECKQALTESESREGAICDACCDVLQGEQNDERRHPDDKGDR